MELWPYSAVDLRVPVLGYLRVLLHALVVISDLVVRDSLEVLNDELVKDIYLP